MASIRSPRLPWRRIAALSLAFLLTAAGRLHGQSFDATNLREPAELNGVWLIHAGDDPAYANPAFDDSRWTPFDIRTSIKKILGASRPPVIWYRLHLKVNPTQSGLALLEYSIGGAFEIYTNGRQLLSVGSVAPYNPHTYNARLLVAIPPPDIATGSIVLALRVHVSPFEWGGTDPGYSAGNLAIGQQAALHDHMWLDVVGEITPQIALTFSGMALGIVALALYWAQPGSREYLWLFLQFLATSLFLPISLYEVFHTLPWGWDHLRLALVFTSDFFAILLYFAMLRLSPKPWMKVFFVVSALGVIVFIAAVSQGFLSLATAQIALLPLTFFSFGVLPVLMVNQWRRGNGEAGLLLIPLVLTGLTVYLQFVLFLFLQFSSTAPVALRIATFFNTWRIGPFVITAGILCAFLYVLSLAIIIVLRATRVSRQQALLETEMAAAREVQQVILPDAIQSVPGFHIESVYQPAQQVGGDFFQILPTRDGGLLLVIGDVAGKGLPAAMLVSVLVGATRGVAEYTNDPAELLANLNKRLVGRGGGSFSTALVALFRPHGSVAIANAGHLPPYLDGMELQLPGELPLGVAAGTQYKITEIHLQPGSRLTFISDGVVEAQNQKGELFGFDQSLALSTQPAQIIVDAALRFGQKDDITVVAVQRNAASISVSETVIAVPVLTR